MAKTAATEAIPTPVIDWSAARLPTRVQRLANGLTVIAHPDHKSPVVAVYVGYRSGSRDEPRGKAGVAHLCEHLMYSGTKAFPGSYFAPFEQAGAAWMNAFVKEDYSAYFATMPAGALDFALRMEADRLVHLAEALDDEKVDRQREVVRNELRQRESEPYGGAIRMLAELGHPSDHPYAHPPDGLVEQLDNISLDDVREWIETRHLAANVEIIIAGDVEPGDAIEKARHHFEAIAIAPRPAITGPAHPVDNVAGASRKVIERAVKNAKLYIAWNGPAFASPDYPALEAACEILAGGRSSRLWRRIVDAERLATELAVEFRPRALGSLVVLQVTASDGVPLDAIERAVRLELESLSRHGPTRPELAIARLRLFGRLVRGIERVGGPQSKSDMLGLAALVGGSPDIHEQRISHIAAMAPDAIVAAVRWLATGGAVLEMHAAA
jgi:zinc protease